MKTTVTFVSYYKSLVNHLPASLKKQLPKQVAVVAISEQKSRELNRSYRKKDTATNVLSFRYGPDEGEILVCPTVIRREAKEQGHSYDYQMTRMILHGMIHLAKLHHERRGDHIKRFERIEKRILDQLFSSKVKSQISKRQLKS